MNQFGVMTPEQRELAQQRKAEIKAWGEANLKQQFDDEPTWRDLASKYGIRMPARYMPGTDLKYLKRALRTVGMTPAEWCMVNGVSGLRAIAQLNPTWPAYALIGLLLEHVDEQASSKEEHEAA